tara:strand:- start:832 stop:1776 length:945 start_codon:yes stop_codon:yes gene_type:complete
MYEVSNMAEEKVIEDDAQEVEITVDDSKTLVNGEQSADSSSTEVEVTTDSESVEDGEELDDYSKRVRKRIKTLTDKYRTEERNRDEAVRYAQQVKDENDKLKQRMQSLDKGYITEYGSRIESQLASAKQLYKEAHEAGDADALFNAQETLSKIAIEQERHRMAKQRQEQQVAPVEQKIERPVTQTQQAPVQAQQPVDPDPKAKGWAEKNTWFGDDEIMTQAAFTIHRRLVEEEGFDPQADEYYSEIDKRIRGEFPQKFSNVRKNGGSAKVASADTSASRNSKSGRRTVKLSPSQIAIAKKLGVPLEEYAKYVKD